MKKFAACLLLSMLFTVPALAQTCPLSFHDVLTPGQWQACFNAKQTNLGYTPVNRAGDTMTGELTLPPSTTTNAGFNLPPGAAPTSPSDGDIWPTTVGFFFQINSLIVGILPPSLISALPTCNAAAKGWRGSVTNANGPTFLGTLTAGGSVVTPVFCNGAAWVPG